jgi:hypothetical protein
MRLEGQCPHLSKSQVCVMDNDLGTARFGNRTLHHCQNGSLAFRLRKMIVAIGSNAL